MSPHQMSVLIYCNGQWQTCLLEQISRDITRWLEIPRHQSSLKETSYHDGVLRVVGDVWWVTGVVGRELTSVMMISSHHLQGHPGPVGPIGQMGPPGDSGDIGYYGARGEQGPKGEKVG